MSLWGGGTAGCTVTVWEALLRWHTITFLSSLSSGLCLYIWSCMLVFPSCFPGENVKEFFSRVAALAFEQSMLKELEKSNGRMAQIGAGNLISTFSFTLSLSLLQSLTSSREWGSFLRAKFCLTYTSATALTSLSIYLGSYIWLHKSLSSYYRKLILHGIIL